jgi:hypothetical protein
MKLFRTISLLLALVAVPAVASASNGGGEKTRTVKVRDHRTSKERGMNRIAKLDANNDGALSASEVSGTRLADRFATLDSDADGSLTKQELVAGIKERKQDGKAHAWGKGHGKANGKGRGKGKGMRQGRGRKMGHGHGRKMGQGKDA